MATIAKTENISSKAQPALKKLVSICVDLGTSAIKVVYLIDDVLIDYLEITPEYKKLPAHSAQQLPVDRAYGLSEDTAWIRYDKNGECHLVGNLAIEYKGFAAKKTLKWEMAAPKILSAIAIVLERENLAPSKAKLSVLGVLLPPEEMPATDELRANLLKLLKVGFYWRDRKFKITVAKGAICIAAETNGLILDDLEKYPQMSQQVWVYSMSGEKHSTLTTSVRGSLSRIHSGSKDLGFFNLDRMMSEKIPGWKARDLQAVLSMPKDNRKLDVERYIQLNDSPTIDWHKLARLRQAKNIEIEAERLESAYQESLEQYWFDYRDWLVETAPSPEEIDTIIFAGGTNQLLKPQINDYFADCAQKFWGVHALEVIQILGINERTSSRSSLFLSKNYHVRYADVTKYLMVLTGYQLEEVIDDD